MTIRARSVRTARALALPLLLAALPVACRGETTSPGTAGNVAELPADQIVYGLEHNMTADGVRRAHLVGDTAYMHEQGSRIDIVGVHLDMYDNNGRPSAVLTSKTGEYDTRAGQLVARGNVVLVTEAEQGNRRLETEELFYNVQSDQLWSDQPFVMTENGRTTRGTSFRSDGRFQNVTVQQPRGAIPGATGQELRF